MDAICRLEVDSSLGTVTALNSVIEYDRAMEFARVLHPSAMRGQEQPA